MDCWLILAKKLSQTLVNICQFSKFPVIAIGNIQVQNVVEIIKAGAYGIAILSAFSCSPNPVLAANEFMKEINKEVSNQIYY